MHLSKRALGVAPSMTLAVDTKAKQLRAQGADVVGFAAGEPDFATPDHIIAAAKAALDAGKTRYTPVPGELALREAICEKLKKDNGLTYDPSQIVVSTGAKQCLYNVFQATIDPGDEVIIPGPMWVSYPEMVKLAGGVPVIVDCPEQAGFKMTAEQFAAAITDKTVALVLNSPCNPTGAVYSRQELKAIADICCEKDILIISDEIYELLVYEGEHVSIASLSPEVQARTVVINGMSKAYAMTGWRLGYSACDAALAKVISNIQSQSTSNPNSFAQYGAIAALTGDMSQSLAMKEEFAARRVILCDGLNAIPGVSCTMPQGAFYVMAKVSGLYGKTTAQGAKITDSLSFCSALLDEALVAAVPGIAFAADEYVRLSYAISRENLQKGLDRIAAFAASLTD